MPAISKLKLGDRLAHVLGAEAEGILGNDFLQVKELEDKNIEEIKEEYEFEKIKDAFNEGVVLPQLDLFYGGEHLPENFIRACSFLSLNQENIGFVDFLCSDRGQNIMKNSSLFIHNESENIFYQNFKTN